MSHIQLNYAFMLFWSIFREIHWKLLFLVKIWLSQKEALKYVEKLLLLTSLIRRKARRKFGFVSTTFFDQTSKRGQILTKTVFLHKMSHIQLNYASLLFWSIFGEIHRKFLLFVVKKVIISETCTEILRKFVFLKKFE